jgi:hypothetical protein
MKLLTACSWSDFKGNEPAHSKDLSRIVIMPDGECKEEVLDIFTGLNPGSVYTVPGLVEEYISGKYKKRLIGKHGLECIIGDIIGKDFTSYLKMEKYRQGYIKALADFIYNFRSTSDLDFISALNDFKAGALTLKEKDLVRIYCEFEKKLPEYGYDIRSGILDFISSVTNENIFSCFGLSHDIQIIFFGFNGISSLEKSFIEKIIKTAENVFFLRTVNKCAAKQAVRIEKNIDILLESVKDNITEEKVLAGEPGSLFIEVSDNLYKSKTGSDLKAGFFEGSINVLSENNRFDETVALARKIKGLMQRGVAPDRIRIVAPCYDLYMTVIREVFPDYGIPVFAEEGARLMHFPLAILLQNLLNRSVKASNYSLRDKIFQSQYISYRILVKPEDLKDFQKQKGIELLQDDIISGFIGVGEMYQLDNNFLKDLNQKAYQAVKPRDKASQIEVVKRYFADISFNNEEEKSKKLFDCLVQFYLLYKAEKAMTLRNVRMDPDGFKETVLNMLKQFNIIDNIKQLNGIGLYEKRVLKEELAVLDCIEKLLDEVKEIFMTLSYKYPDGFTLAELVRTLQRLIGEAKIYESDCEGVSVQAVRALQCKNREYTFICGMVDGEFPEEEKFNFLQPKKEGLNLGSTFTSVDYARNYFYHLVRSNSKELILSYPLSHNGRKLPPSPFIKDINRCIAALKSGASAGQPDSEQVLSFREKCLYIGKYVDNKYEKVLPLLKEIKDSNPGLLSNILDIMRFDGLVLSSDSLSEYDGVFSGNNGSFELISNDCDGLTFNPQKLERYAVCPMRFFFDDIMGLQDYDPDKSETGLMLHSILSEYTEKAVKAKSVPDDAPVFLSGLIKDYTDSSREDGQDAFSVRFINSLLAGLGEEKKQRPGLLYAFLKYEKEAPDLLEPYMGRFSGKVSIEGMPCIDVRIDRVDKVKSENALIPFLYKTGKIDDSGKIKRGLKFELPLMIFLLNDYLKEEEIDIPGAGQYLVRSPKALKRGGYFAVNEMVASRKGRVSVSSPVFSGQKEGLFPKDNFEGALNKIKGHILSLYELMKKGVFHQGLCSESDRSCTDCSFRFICRKDQQKLEKLSVKLADNENIYSVKEII